MGGGEGVGSSSITPINSTNIGFQLLKKHGWIEGTGLGVSQQGRLEPIQTYLKKDKGGLGAAGKGIRCEICKIDCNSWDVLGKHLQGKKHKRNVDLLQTIPPAIIPSLPDQSLMQMTSGEVLEGGASADSILFCTICNVACNSQAVFISHLSGRKHAAQVLENAKVSNDNTNSTAPIVEPILDSQQTNKGEVVDLSELKRKMMSMQTPEDIEMKKRKIVEGGAAESDIKVCVLCNVVCNSQAVFITHLSGRKHAAQVLEISNASSGNTDSTVPIVEPVVDNMEMAGGTQTAPDPEGIERKKQKIVEGGAAESDIRVCTLCNVVCNSPAVFKLHLSGQKHATMVRNQAEAEKNKANVQAAL